MTWQTLPDAYYYRRLRSTGIWHIVSWERGSSECKTLCGQGYEHDCSEGYAPALGKRHDPAGTCETCKLLADGMKQLSLLDV